MHNLGPDEMVRCHIYLHYLFNTSCVIVVVVVVVVRLFIATYQIYGIYTNMKYSFKMTLNPVIKVFRYLFDCDNNCNAIF